MKWWNMQDNLSVILAYNRLFTGGFLRDAGIGGDVSIGYLMAQFDMSSSMPRVPEGPK